MLAIKWKSQNPCAGYKGALSLSPSLPESEKDFHEMRRDETRSAEVKPTGPQDPHHGVEL